MAPQDILEKIKAHPFQPFRIHISDGASYDVTDASHAYIAVTELAVGVELDEYGVPVKSIYIAPNHVTRIEPILPEKKPSNGGKTS